MVSSTGTPAVASATDLSGLCSSGSQRMAAKPMSTDRGMLTAVTRVARQLSR